MKADVNDSRQTLVCAPPAIEAFFDPSPAETWLAELIDNNQLMGQLAQRQNACACLSRVINGMADPTLELTAAIESGAVSKKAATDLFQALADLLEDGPDYIRLILYLPFEFLPEIDWSTHDIELTAAIERFRNAYMSAWRKLLNVHDVRANFVDGDVMDIGWRVGDLPRVVKAAHLIPWLIEKGWVDTGSINNLLARTNDPLLWDSITEALAASDQAGVEVPVESVYEFMTFHEIADKLDSLVTAIGSKDYGAVADKRRDWLRQQDEAEAIALAAADLQRLFEHEEILGSEIEYIRKKTSSYFHQALIEGLRLAIISPDGMAAGLLERYYATMLNWWWREENVAIKECLAKNFRHFRHLGLLAEWQFARLGVGQPCLMGPFSANIPLLRGELVRLGRIITDADSCPELSQLIYPAVLVYGSRLKGYGTECSDIDVAVFVRPGARYCDRHRLRSLLQDYFGCYGSCLEFWLNDENGSLSVEDYSASDIALGNSYFAHVLLGAAWIGFDQIISELRQKLLTPYLVTTSARIFGRPVRRLHLEELERDALLYRLLHKGYERFYPPCSRRSALKMPDRNPVFWDSGYRRLAIQLYLSQVFLPQVA